jgi:alkanesulfonate monooxygenase SsuD/methylene tetrahydromethanopterin reductase-like flavin-dependent oxidoreductase (luciferase family)
VTWRTCRSAASSSSARPTKPPVRPRGPAAEKLTAGYRRGGDQLRRGILTEEEHDTERRLREVAIVGSPETLAERVAALHAEFGFGNFMLVTGFLGNLPQEHVVKTLELFAKEVRPRVQRTIEPVEHHYA